MTARRFSQLRKLTEVSRALTYAVSLDDVLRLTVQRAADLLDAPQSVLMLVNADGLLSIRASMGIEESVTQRFAEPLNESLISRLTGLFGGTALEFIGVPLVVGGEVTGILAVSQAAGHTVEDEQEWILSALADQASLALERSRLNEMAEFRERLLGIIGHDLRNPLSAISMGAEQMVRPGTLPESQERVARRIMRSASRMEGMINQLTDFTRARLGGGIPIRRAPVDLAEVCRQVLEELKLSKPTAELRFQLQGENTGNWDAGRLAQLVGNLVGNAIEHGRIGTAVTVKLQAAALGSLITVHNLGDPIPEGMLGQIFDPFRRGSEAPTPVSNLGLGLYIAEQITRAHQGSISVTSSASEGTTFTVLLPRGLPAP